MANRRMLSKSISTSRRLTRVEVLDALIFTWTIPHCDDGGNMDADPSIVRGTVCPMLSITVEEVQASLERLASVGLISIYEANGEKFMHIDKWEKHQTLRTDRLDLRFPHFHGLPPVADGLPAGYQVVALREGKRREGKGSKEKTTRGIKKKEKSVEGTVLTQKQQQAIAFMQWWNRTFGKNYSDAEAIENNLEYWVAKYSPRDIAQAAVNAKKDGYWKNIMDPYKFLRRKNPKGEAVDRIGEFLNVGPSGEPQAKMVW